MRTRFLGVLLIALVILGGLNIAQAIRANFFQGPGLAQLPDLPPIPDLPPMPAMGELDVDMDFDSDRRADEVMIDRTFKVAAGDWLNIDVQHSDIVIRTSSTDEAHIRISIDARNMDRAEEVFNRMDFRVEQDGDRIVIRSDQPRGMNWRTRMSIEVEASIPSSFNLELESSHGDVDLDDLDGDVMVRTTHGDVTAGSIKGERIAFHTTHGDLEADGLSAARVELETTHGDIEADVVEADEFEASTTHSDVLIDQLFGRSTISTTHGDVEIGVAEAYDVAISTSHGDVDLFLAGDYAADLDLRGQEVRIPSSADFSGTIKEKMAEGTLNGGGVRLDVETSFGDITLHMR